MKKTLSILSLLAFLFTSAAFGDAPQAQKTVPYALQTCFISGDKLGEMGKPVVFEYKGQEIKLCCKKCKRKFDANPDKGLKDYQAAVEKAQK